ncbi:rhodopsin, G0-coupled-like [Hydra vulgaris]|uniref:rhodopsin, G0-coupled-like n=1 Tax=Hydra vulgaris TaxID=6087 RepID=UPI0006411807|nr:rhodopsin, G0-coupled-like [Hydra vulgaris]
MDVLVSAYFVCVLVIIILSILLNALLIYIIVYKIKVTKLPHVFILSISISDVIHTLIGYIAEVWVLFEVHSLKKSFVCIGPSFITVFTSVSNILQTVTISIMRAIAIKWPFFYIIYCKTMKMKILLLFFCYFYGFFWPFIPLIGWSKYELDLDELRCSFDWKLMHSDSLSYLIVLLIFCYILPVIALIFAYITLKKTVVDSSTVKRAQLGNNRNIQEMVYLKLAFWSAIFYFIVWTPYASASLLSIFKIKSPNVIYTLCALFSKLSSISNALTNCYFNKYFRNHLKKIKLFQYFVKWNRRSCDNLIL